MSRVKNTLDKSVLLISTTINYFNIQKDFSEGNKYITRSSQPKNSYPGTLPQKSRDTFPAAKIRKEGSKRYLMIGPNQVLVNYRWDDE